MWGGFIQCKKLYYEDQKFENVKLDGELLNGYEFVDCTFENCTICVSAHKYAVVVLGILVQQSRGQKGVDDLCGDPTLAEVGEHAPVLRLGAGRAKGTFSSLGGGTECAGVGESLALPPL